MTASANLTSGRLLARNTIINLIGEVAPFAVALVAVPIIVHRIGVDRYGVLTLSLMSVGYFGIFDLGLGSASTKFIAKAAAEGDTPAVSAWFWTSLCLMFVCGLMAAAVIAAMAPWLAHILNVPVAIRPESVHAFYVLAAAMPFVISGGSLISILSAYQRFDLINLVRVPSGILSYMLPLAVLAFSHSIAWIVAAVVAGRIASWIANGFQCLHAAPSLLNKIGPRRDAIRPLLSFGGWMTISGIFGPIMTYFDRFLIGAMLSTAAVTYYSVPFQVVSKMQVLPAAMSGVVFAAFSGSFARDPQRALLIFERASRYTLMALFGPTLLFIALAPEGLTLWLGAPFAAHSTTVLRVLAVGVFANCLAWTPFNLVLSAHRPDLTAKVHVAEVPFYLAFLWWVLPRYGVGGAAVAWTLRSTADMVIFYLMARQLLPLTRSAIARIAKSATLAASAFALAAIPMRFESKVAFLACLLGALGVLGWTVMLVPSERAMLWKFGRQVFSPDAAAIEQG